jgi:hypothetical protein
MRRFMAYYPNCKLVLRLPNVSPPGKHAILHNDICTMQARSFKLETELQTDVGKQSVDKGIGVEQSQIVGLFAQSDVLDR